MGLYLCVRNESDEIDGADFGTYGDFGAFRSFVASQLESGNAGSRFPALMLHSDCDGEWSVAECVTLQDELLQIGEVMFTLPVVPSIGDWQQKVLESRAIHPRNALESFIDASGVPVIMRLMQLIAVAVKNDRPILFQ